MGPADKEVLMALVSVPECPSCHRLMGEKHKTVTKRPTMASMNRWISNAVAKATDGCEVEPDGICEHGHSSWLLVLCLI